MATNSSWTVVFDDKVIIKQKGDAAGTGYVIEDNDFWGLAKWNNIWAIQYGATNVNDQVEHRDSSPHTSWDEADLGDFQDFISRWDAAHLAKLQADWDADTSDESVKGPRPTSYSS